MATTSNHRRSPHEPHTNNAKPGVKYTAFKECVYKQGQVIILFAGKMFESYPKVYDRQCAQNMEAVLHTHTLESRT